MADVVECIIEMVLQWLMYALFENPVWRRKKKKKENEEQG